MENENSIVYDIDIKNILKKLEDCELSAIQDPKEISGYVYACTSEPNKHDALSKLKTASLRAQKAREAAFAENICDAFNWWDKVFSDNFPSYYC